MSKAKRLRKKSTTRSITLSEAASKLALELAVLPSLAHGDQASSARYSVVELITLVNIIATPMKEDGDVFANVGGSDDVVEICGRSYPSAHRAALGEAKEFLDWLWFHLDQEGRESTHRIWVELGSKGKANSTAYRRAYQQSMNATGMDPDRVVENWQRAKAGIRELLPKEWRRDFNHIGSRIARERASVESARRPDTFVPNQFQLAILKALHGRALNKQDLANEVCGGEGSRLYRPNGIKELMGMGKVRNKRRLGYYRPDAPPSAL
jgi:hypothetical protein